jgi:pantetheine-phosphate adenylyltransferase
LETRFPGREFAITELTQSFGPGIFTSEVQAIAASSETAERVEEANKRRRELGLPDLKIEIIPMVLAHDGEKISSTRIRNSEIDEQGKSKE